MQKWTPEGIRRHIYTVLDPYLPAVLNDLTLQYVTTENQLEVEEAHMKAKIATWKAWLSQHMPDRNRTNSRIDTFAAAMEAVMRKCMQTRIMYLYSLSVCPLFKNSIVGPLPLFDVKDNPTTVCGYGGVAYLMGTILPAVACCTFSFEPIFNDVWKQLQEWKFYRKHLRVPFDARFYELDEDGSVRFKCHDSGDNEEHKTMLLELNSNWTQKKIPKDEAWKMETEERPPSPNIAHVLLPELCNEGSCSCVSRRPRLSESDAEEFEQWQKDLIV